MRIPIKVPVVRDEEPTVVGDTVLSNLRSWRSAIDGAHGAILSTICARDASVSYITAYAAVVAGGASYRGTFSLPWLLCRHDSGEHIITRHI